MNKLNHVAFIMDGNGRWGKNKKEEEITEVYLKGVKTVEKMVKVFTKVKNSNYYILCFFQLRTGKDQKTD